MTGRRERQAASGKTSHPTCKTTPVTTLTSITEASTSEDPTEDQQKSPKTPPFGGNQDRASPLDAEGRRPGRQRPRVSKSQPAVYTGCLVKASPCPRPPPRHTHTHTHTHSLHSSLGLSLVFHFKALTTRNMFIRGHTYVKISKCL